jgi:nucleotide-binding universal stress UspA family protein
MDRGLVVLRDTGHTEQLLREAGEHAAGVGAELLLLSFISEDDYEENLETLNSIGDIENVNYDETAALEAVEEDVEDAAKAAFGDRSVDYVSNVVVTEGDEYADATLEVAAEHDCDHVYVVGRERTPTGKAIFGDQVQKLILNFDGFVTVTMQ